jgi:hypothetical protein
MKKLLLLGVIVCFGLSHSQANGVKTMENFEQDNPTELQSPINLMSNNAKKIGAFHVYKTKKSVEGTTYLFDKWENNGILITKKGKRFSLKNINLNLKRNVFESKYNEEKIFTFNYNNINKFIVNDKIYKNYYHNDDVKIYEIVYESSEFQLLKGFKINLIEASPNPMLNRSIDRFVKKEDYFIKRAKEIIPLKLKKNKIKK